MAGDRVAVVAADAVPGERPSDVVLTPTGRDYVLDHPPRGFYEALFHQPPAAAAAAVLRERKNQFGVKYLCDRSSGFSVKIRIARSV